MKELKINPQVLDDSEDIRKYIAKIVLIKRSK